jgi:hypothetical protein
MKTTAEEIAALSPERRRLLELLLRQEAATHADRETPAGTATPTGATRAIPRRPDTGPAPLSFSQQRLWFLHQLDPANPAYNLHAAVRMRGPLHVGALKATLAEIVSRHEALRTTFVVVARQPAQIVGAAQALELPLFDLSGWPESETEVRRLAMAEAARPFDLTQWPLVRATLFRLAAEDHVVLLTMHHIISDGWSMGVLVSEVAALYEAHAAGRPSPLAELSIQFADFAVWERRLLQGAALTEQLAYWKRQLGGAIPQLELPTDRARVPGSAAHGAAQSFALSESLSAALKTLCQQEGVTLFMLLLAAYNVLLCRYTGQEDILVGSPVANRSRAETEPLIGCFINTLVLRTDLSGNPTFRELLRRVRAVVIGAFAHQDVPFEKVVEELRPERAAGQQRFFRVWFVLQNAPMQPLRLPGLLLSDFKVERTTAQFDLALSVVEAGARVVGTLDYNSDLFDADTVAEMLARFTVLLQGAAAAPETPLLDIPLDTSSAADWPARGAAAADAAEDQFAL